jgi:ATP phosphoribosyltransferase
LSSNKTEIRLALPSKGLLEESALELLAGAGLACVPPNPRQYRATIPNLPGLTVIFQRPGDIVVSVRDGSVDFGDHRLGPGGGAPGPGRERGHIHPGAGFGHCALNVIVPEAWDRDRIA